MNSYARPRRRAHHQSAWVSECLDLEQTWRSALKMAHASCLQTKFPFSNIATPRRGQGRSQTSPIRVFSSNTLQTNILNVFELS
jgi:hypothetical protein